MQRTNHSPLLWRSRNKARLTGSCVLQLLGVLLAGNRKRGKKKAFLDSLDISGLRQQQCFIYVPLHLCCDSISSMDGQNWASGLYSPEWVSLPSKEGHCWRMRYLIPERTNCRLIWAACLIGEVKKVQAALWGMNKEVGHKKSRKVEFAGVNSQICPIKLEGLCSVCCKNTHGFLTPLFQAKHKALSFMLSWK